MKRLISVILLVLMVATSAVALASEYSSLSDEQLKEQYNAIRNELSIRGLKAENKTVIFEEGDIQFYINGDMKIDKPYDWYETNSLYIPIVVVNNSKSNISIRIENASVNGWSTTGDDDGGDTPAGKKAKANLVFELANTDVETLEGFTDVEFTVIIYDYDTLGTIVKKGPITVYAKK